MCLLQVQAWLQEPTASNSREGERWAPICGVRCKRFCGETKRMVGGGGWCGDHVDSDPPHPRRRTLLLHAKFIQIRTAAAGDASALI